MEPEEEAASTVIHEPMEDLPAEPEPEREREPEPEQDPVQQDPAPASEEADGAAVVNPAADAEYHEADAEVDTSGDSSERKAASTEDDTAADGRKYSHRHPGN